MHQTPKSKKLVLVLAIFTSVTRPKKALIVRVLDRIPYIRYPVQFGKDKSKDVLALLDSGSKINAMTSVFLAQLSLKAQKTNVGA